MVWTALDQLATAWSGSAGKCGQSPKRLEVGQVRAVLLFELKDVVLVSGFALYDEEFDKIAPQVCGEVEVDVKLFLDTINVFNTARGRSYALSTVE